MECVPLSRQCTGKSQVVLVLCIVTVLVASWNYQDFMSTSVKETLSKPETQESMAQPQRQESMAQPETQESTRRRESFAKLEDLESLTKPGTQELLTQPGSVESLTPLENLESLTQPETLKSLTQPETLKSFAQPRTLESLIQTKTVESTTQPETQESTIQPETQGSTTLPETIEPKTQESVTNVANENKDIIKLLTVPAPCGDVCSYTAEVVDEGTTTVEGIPQLRKRIDCVNIMKRMAYRNHTILNPPPKQPPAYLYNEYFMDGKMEEMEYYKNDMSDNFTHQLSDIEELIRKVKLDEAVSSYREKCVQHAVPNYSGLIQNRHGVVVGTQKPWAEAVLIANKAKYVTTLEYNKPVLNHSKIEVHTPYEFAELYLAGAAPTFDFGVSFSSMEHTGLGRYGDPLNPYGDLEAMAQVWCMLKPGGLFILGLPRGDDAIYWNAHRVYGTHRLPQITANFKILENKVCKSHNLLILVKV